MSKAKDNAPKFEDAVTQIEQIVERIESGQIDLEKCLAEYERGRALVDHCQKILDAVQGRMAELQVTATGGLKGEKPAAPGVAGDAGDDEAEGVLDPADEPSPDEGGEAS